MGNKFYYEVQVNGKTKWTLGVATESSNRKGGIMLSPDTGYWTIWLRNGNEYEALADPSVSLSLKSRPQKVGVFVDYEEGLVSFYDVDAAALIYSFTVCCFTEKLFPYFNPKLNDARLGLWNPAGPSTTLELPRVSGGEAGVGLLIAPQLSRQVLEFTPVNERVASLRLHGSGIGLLLLFVPTGPNSSTEYPAFLESLGRDWTEVSVRPSYDGTVRRAVAQLEETLSKEMKKLVEAELKKVQQYAVDVTLDPDTAHPNLILSEDGKQVSHGGVRKNLPDNPERFDKCVCVLGKQSFSPGIFYFEVLVKGKTEWDFGVARESIDRKGGIMLSPDTGYWTIWLTNGNEYNANDDPPVRLSLKSRPQKVGVFVDYEEGLVSFYDVDAAALIYSSTGCSFGEKRLPYFSPEVNDDDHLIISPVRVN
ncbi:hypothetical protein L3Q82_005550 [Scortum barcoo]|uniref:Uncharacterized protein n=1 Tax=Scortum barcoo TaxID=214431 RepID=A0ACB8VCI6_9TELE|nr:hypothetical protein L3Q82_005550 [Scortum barcoo]